MTRSIQEIQSDLVAQRAGLARQTARQVIARGKLRAPLRDREGRPAFSGLSNINKRQRAEINSAGQQITRIRKRIIAFEAELLEHQGVTSQTSAFQVGSTFGSASSSALTQSLPPLLTISRGIYEIKNNRLLGESIVILQSPQDTIGTPLSFFLITVIATPQGSIKRVKTNRINFTESERDELIRINESAFNETRLKITQFVSGSPQPEDRLVGGNTFSQVLNFEAKAAPIIPPTQPPFDPPPIDPPLPPPFIPPDEPPIEEERDLFQTAIVGAIGIGILASLMGKGKKK